MKFNKVLDTSKITLMPDPRSRTTLLKAKTIKKTPFTWKYESLNFDMLESKIYKDRVKDHYTMVMEWVAYALVGFCSGLVTAVLSHMEHFLIHEKRHVSDLIIAGDDGNLVTGWIFYLCASSIMVFLAAVMTVYWAPGATGSGNAELIGYLNGVNYPNLFSFETLVVKIFGVLLAVSGGLAVGKEGPSAHFGAIIGSAVPYFPLPRFEWLRNDIHKRELIAAGCSAGVSTAFGSPIGGTLFAYELSKPNTFWRFGVLWKSFFACSIAVLTVTIFYQLMNFGEIKTVGPVELKFGQGRDVKSPDMASFICAVIVGIVGGILGSLFILVNTGLSKLRKKLIRGNRIKVLEAVLFAALTSTTFFWVPYLMKTCNSNLSISPMDKPLLTQYSCKEGEHNPLASLFMNDEVGAIRTIMSGYDDDGGIMFTKRQMAVFLMVWFFFTITTYGIWVPAGIFLPGIIIGSAIGSIYEDTVRSMMSTGPRDYDQAVVPILISAGAMLSAYTRLTYSLVVVMLETTSSLNMFGPMLVAVMVARGVANFFTPSLYANAIKAKQIPILPEHAHRKLENLEACEIMSVGMVSLPSLCTANQVREALMSRHGAYPVTNTANRLVGLIPRRMLITLTEKRAFYDKLSIAPTARFVNHEDQENLDRVLERNKELQDEFRMSKIHRSLTKRSPRKSAPPTRIANEFGDEELKQDSKEDEFGLSPKPISFGKQDIDAEDESGSNFPGDSS